MNRVAVIGAGMAGLTAARRLLLAGCDPILIAPRVSVPPRGETLSAGACDTFEELGWAGLLSDDVVAPVQSRFSVWGDKRLRRAGRARDGLHIDRPLLQAKMAADLGEAALERVVATVTGLAHCSHGVELELSDHRRLQAGAAIDCTGRTALSSGPAADRRRHDRLVAAYRVVELPEDAEPAPATLVEAVETGWWYMAPVPTRRLIIALFTDSDLVPPGAAKDGRAWLQSLRETTVAQARMESLGLGVTIATLLPVITSAASITNAKLTEGWILRAGDSAAAMDPLGANGLAVAAWSGVQAADACLAMLSGDDAAMDRYQCSFLDGVARQLTMQREMYASERRFADAPFWRRRHSQLMQ